MTAILAYQQKLVALVSDPNIWWGTIWDNKAQVTFLKLHRVYRLAYNMAVYQEVYAFGSVYDLDPAIVLSLVCRWKKVIVKVLNLIDKVNTFQPLTYLYFFVSFTLPLIPPQWYMR